MHNFTPVAGAIGGLLIGLSSSLMMLFVGRITGISGIVGGVLMPRAGEFSWRLSFLLGMFVGGGVLLAFHGAAFPTVLPRSTGMLLVAGILVGVGTRMGSGCTSGHGVCGMARLSVRSFVAVGVFLTTGMITVFLTGLLG
jgi:uncharacterized membrane protein YedE/YeeE